MLNPKLHFVLQSHLLLNDSGADSAIQLTLSLETTFCIWNCVVLLHTAATVGWELLGNSFPPGTLL